jgi:hypothetical protein
MQYDPPSTSLEESFHLQFANISLEDEIPFLWPEKERPGELTSLHPW